MLLALYDAIRAVALTTAGHQPDARGQSRRRHGAEPVRAPVLGDTTAQLSARFAYINAWSDAVSQVSDLLSKLVGEPVWGVRRSNGSSFLIEVGQPHLPVRQTSDIDAKWKSFAIGDFELLLFDCYWYLIQGSVELTDASSIKDIDNFVQKLNGTNIISANEQRRSESKVTIVFDNEASLVIEPNPEVGLADNWSIYIQGEGTVALCPDGSVVR